MTQEKSASTTSMGWLWGIVITLLAGILGLAYLAHLQKKANVVYDIAYFTNPQRGVVLAPLKYDKPSGWQEIKAEHLGTAHFILATEPQRVRLDITVFENPLRPYDFLNLWRKQFGLEELPPEQRESLATLKTKYGIARYAELQGKLLNARPGGPTLPDRKILYCIMPFRNHAVVIACNGYVPGIDAEKQNIFTFIKSLRIGE